MIARFNPASIKKKPRYMVQNLVPDSNSAKKAASAAAIVAGVPAAREVALKNLGSGAEAAYPMQPAVYGGQDTDASSPGPTQITDPNAPQNIPSQRESTPEVGIERQPVIANQSRGARYDPDSIMGFVSSLVGNPKANEAFDPTKPIGGANVPYQEAKGLQRFFGNQANQLNLGAQQAQGAKWEAEDALAKQRQAKREDLAEEITLRTEAERGLKKEDREFTAGQSKAARDFQAAENSLDRVMRSTEGGLDRNLRISLATADRDAAADRLNKELGFRASESAADRAFRSGESQADRAARLAEGEANRAVTAAHYNLIREDNAADRNLRASEGAAGRAIDEARLGLQREGQGAEIQYRQRPRFERLGENVYTNEKGEVFEYSPGMPAFGNTKGTPGGFRRLPTPGAMAPKGSGGGQVDRTTGATLGGPLMNNQLPPGGGVRMGGALPPTPQVTPMRAAAPSPEADASLLGRFRTAMPSLNFAQPSGRGYQVAPLTEGDVAQQAMEQIAYPLRAAAAQEAKSGFQNPEEAAYILEEKPKWRFRRAGATEMSEARKAGDILRQMYAE